MYLPGTVNERIGDLRSRNKINQRDLCALIGVTPSVLSRIENGETQRINSEILVKLAKVFHVSTDYILGLTTVSVPKSYDISELGLSEGTVKALMTGAVDAQLLNSLIEHKSFPYMLYLIKKYFEDTIAAGIRARNEIIDMATATLGDFIKENPEHKSEGREDMRLLRSEKIGEHEAEIEKIKNMFISILKDIKKDMETDVPQGTPATSDFMKQMREQMQAAQKTPKDISTGDLAAITADMVGKVLPMDGESAALFKQLAERMMVNGVVSNTSND